MFWRSENEVIVEFIKIFRRVLRYKTSWTNKDFKIVSISGKNSPKIYEKFFEENEQYPIITVGGGGFIRTNQAFNSFLGTYQCSIVDLGTRGLGLGLIDETHSIAAAIPSSLTKNDSLYAIEVYLSAINDYNNLDGIDVTLYKNYQSSPSAVASASITDVTDTAYTKYYVEFFPTVSFSGSDYWLKFTTSPDNGAYVGLDVLSDNEFQYIYTGSVVNASGSIHGSLYEPPYMRLGGAIEGSITIRCSDKNSTERPRQILSILSNYIELLKQAQLTRGSGTDNTTLALGNDDVIDEWLEKDIRIKGIRQAGSQERRRGDNDVIHSFDLVIDYYTEWNQDYLKDILQTISVEIEEMSATIYGGDEDEVFNVFNPGGVT